MFKNRRYLTCKELAKALNLKSAQYVRDIARLGAIPAMKIGTSWRFDLDEVDAQLRRNNARAVELSMINSNNKEG